MRNGGRGGRGTGAGVRGGGGDVSEEDSAESTAQLIKQAVLFENCDLLADLLAANPGAGRHPDSAGRTPLMLAAHNGRARALELFIAMCPETIGTPSPASSGGAKTALHLASEAGHTEAVALLLSAGADPSPLDGNGYCALELAHIAGHPTVAALLIDSIQAEAERVNGLHARLCAAATEGEVAEIDEVLLRERRGASLDILLNGREDSQGVLYTACMAGRAEATDRLLKQELASAHVLVDTGSGDTVLHAAIASQNILVIKRILEQFPTLATRVDREGATPLHWAVRAANIDVVELLLEHPYPEYSLVDVETSVSLVYRFAFDVNAGDAECRTALYLAVLLNLVDIVGALLKFKLHLADGAVRCPILVDVYCCRGRTPLMVAAYNQSLPLISMLLQHGADVNLPLGVLDESCGESRCVGSGALLEAARANAIQVAHLLLEKGAADTGNRALRLAVARKAEKIARLLLCRLALPDGEHRVNKRSVEWGQMQIGENLLPPSLWPSRAVHLSWSSAGLDCVLADWLTAACLHINTRLRTARLALAAITRVDLAGNRLKIFPSLLWQMPSLRVLNLASNELEEIPAPSAVTMTANAGGYWQHQGATSLLETLIVRENRITVVAAGLLAALPALQTLDLSSNCVQSLPETIWLCPALRDLNVAGNALQALPSGVLLQGTGGAPRRSRAGYGSSVAPLGTSSSSPSALLREPGSEKRGSARPGDASSPLPSPATTLSTSGCPSPLARHRKLQRRAAWPEAVSLAAARVGEEDEEEEGSRDADTEMVPVVTMVLVYK